MIETRIDQTVPPRHDFLEGIYNEAPEQELEAKLGFISLVKPKEAIGVISERILENTNIDILDETFQPAMNTVQKYSDQHGKSFSVIQRLDGARFVKSKPNKIKRTDGVIVSQETKIAWDIGTDFPEETGIVFENSEFLGTVSRRKDGVFVQKDDRVYQIVLDTVKHIAGSMSEHTLQQLEIEYKGAWNKASSLREATEIIDSIAEDIVHLRDIAQFSLADAGINTKITKKSKTKWLRKLKRELLSRAVALETFDKESDELVEIGRV